MKTITTWLSLIKMSNAQLGIFLVSLIIYITAVQLIIRLILRKTPNFSSEDDKNPIYHIVGLALSVMLFVLSGLTVKTIQGTIFLLLLLYASVCDIQTHEVKDFISVMLGITAFVGADTINLKKIMFSGICMFGFLFVCAIISKNKIGGADIKISAACSMILGELIYGAVALCIGLILAVLCQLFSKNRKEKKGFPLVPYLSIAFYIIYLFLIWRS